VFAQNFESIPKMLELKFDKSEFIKFENVINKKVDESNESLKNMKSIIDSKAEIDWVKKMLSKLNHAMKDINKDKEIRFPEPKNDGALLTRIPIGIKCASCNTIVPKALYNDRTNDYKKYLALSPTYRKDISNNNSQINSPANEFNKHDQDME